MIGMFLGVPAPELPPVGAVVFGSLGIVIGGASGAMPPVLGWAAATGTMSGDALLLFLIVFVWTPPHFWVLALYRT